MKKYFIVLFTLVFTILASVIGGSRPAAAQEEVTLKIGIVGTNSVVWKHVADVVKDKGIHLEIVYFDSYPLPNAALDKEEIDLNAFQHHIYLDNEVKQFNYKIEAVADTVFAPLGIYSDKIKSLDELEDGQTIAIPDDVSNGGRAIKLLEAAGLIKVDPKAGLLPTPKDVTENPKNLTLLEIGAANIPATLRENQVAVINSGVATDAGYVPTEDAIFLEKAVEGENPYINVIAIRTADKDKPWVKTILDAYYTKETRDLIIEDSKGSSIPVWEAKE